MADVPQPKRIELFEHASIPKAIWTLATPTIASMIVMVLYNLADTYFIGQTNDPIQVSAVSLAMPMFMVLMAFGNLFGVGGSTSISRALGAKRFDRVKNYSAFCFYGALTFGAILGILSLIFMDQITNMSGATPESFPYVEDYMYYVALGAPFIVVGSSFGNMVRSIGAAKEAMIGMMIGTVVNIILDPIMILGMNLGVSGAAAATVIGNISALLYYVWFFKKPNNILSLNIKYFRARNGIANDVLSIGVPGMISNLLMSVAIVTYNLFLVSYGDAPVAAMGIASKASMLIAMILMGLSLGAQPLVGYNYGAQNYDRMKKAINFVLIVSLILGTIMTIIFFIFSSHIIQMFIDDPEVIQYGTRMLNIQILMGPLLGVVFVSMSTMQAMGKAFVSLIISILRQGLVFIPTMYIANALFQFDGLIWAQTVADCASVCISYLALRYMLNRLHTPADAN